VARRQIVEDPVNHDRWLISYADFITLLFAFFVVMYSISQVNENKYKILSNTLTEAFNISEKTLDPFQIGETPKSNPINLIKLNELVTEDKERGQEDMGSGIEKNMPGGLPNEFKEISDKIEKGFGDLLNEELITVRGNEEWLELELKSSLLFSSGGAQLSNNALELLGEIAGILQEGENPVRVEGFTDNVPINTRLFPSNWELSTARAAAVIQLFIEEGMSPERLAATGYGEYQAIADNTTPEGREKNRRVVLMISKTGELRPTLPEVEQAPASIADQLIEVAPAVLPIIDTTVLIGLEPEPDPQGIIRPPQLEADPAPQAFQTIKLEAGGLLFTSEPQAPLTEE
jgi:chemotaxis protein MotB